MKKLRLFGAILASVVLIFLWQSYNMVKNQGNFYRWYLTVPSIKPTTKIFVSSDASNRKIESTTLQSTPVQQHISTFSQTAAEPATYQHAVTPQSIMSENEVTSHSEGLHSDVTSSPYHCGVNFRNTSINSSSSEFLKRTVARIKTMDNICRNVPFRSWAPIHQMTDKHVFVDEKHRILYFPVFKAGSTSWGLVFAHALIPAMQNISEGELLQEINFKQVLTLPYLNKFPVVKQQYMIDNFFKFTFVREPFERILSAFRNKFIQVGGDFYRERFGRFITKYESSFRTEVDPATTKEYKGKIISFRSFIRYLVTVSPSQYDEHWRLFSKLVYPCASKLDFVGKLETMEEDFNYISQCYLHEGSYSSIFPPKPPDSTAQIKQFYDTADDRDLIKLYKIWKPEYKMFGYKPPWVVEEAYKRLNLTENLFS